MATQTRLPALSRPPSGSPRSTSRSSTSVARPVSAAVDAYETTWTTVADYQDKVADSTKVDWVADAARAQANFTREVTRLYTSTARDLLKK